MRTVRYAVIAAFITACSAGEKATGPGNRPPQQTEPRATSISVVAGGDQIVRTGTTTPIAPSVVVRDQNSNPMGGVSVTFSVKSGGGILTGAVTQTNASGIASVGSWTMGTMPGPNVLGVSVAGGTNPSTEISVTARPPRWTFMVYLAADNTLSLFGVNDVDELEALAANPEVQVVIQGEYSGEQFARFGVGPGAVHLPSFNTFRYAFGGASPLAPAVVGPNGIVTDIGNRNMTDPGQLREFVTWARTTYPAEHYALVLWNHGDGAGGLIEDATSAPGRIMTQRELNSGLSGTGVLDVIDFDMCQMGGYETLETVRGLASFVVFSQMNEPGAGDPYSRILSRLYSTPTMDGRSLAAAIVEEYDASYAGDRSSTTKSAFDMTGYTVFRNALDELANILRLNISSVSGAIRAAAGVSQRYEFEVNKDLVNVLDSLYVRSADQTLRQQINAAKSAMMASTFRVLSRSRTGFNTYALRVDRSSGLHIVLPTNVANDAMSEGGNRSFAEYQLNYPSRPWTEFLKAYVGTTHAAQADLGANPWQLYLVWDSLSFAKHSDVDLWVLEPSGNVFIPFIGTVTPNGHLTGDSEASKAFYEGYSMNRFVQVGRYKFYASLYQDTANTRPLFDVQYRRGYNGSFTSLFSAPFPRLSLQTSWTKDPTPTFAEVESGSYTDLRYAAYVDIAADAAAVTPNVMVPESAGVRQSMAVSEAEAIPTLQLQTIRNLLVEHRARRSERATAPSVELNRQLKSAQPRRQ